MADNINSKLDLVEDNPTGVGATDAFHPAAIEAGIRRAKEPKGLGHFLRGIFGDSEERKDEQYVTNPQYCRDNGIF